MSRLCASNVVICTNLEVYCLWQVHTMFPSVMISQLLVSFMIGNCCLQKKNPKLDVCLSGHRCICVEDKNQLDATE